MFRAHGDSMSVASDANVLVSRVLAGSLALEHLAVLGNAVPLAVRDRVLAIHRLALCRGPRKVIAANLDVIVGKFAELVVVHAEEFGFLGCTEIEAGDLVDDKGEKSTDGKGICSDGHNVSNLLVNGLGSSSNGATCNAGVDTVESDDIVGSKDAVDEQSPHASDAVLSKDIKGVVNLDPEFDYMLLVRLNNYMKKQNTYSLWQSYKRCRW